jgi:hypothetical protein
MPKKRYVWLLRQNRFQEVATRFERRRAAAARADRRAPASRKR